MTSNGRDQIDTNLFTFAYLRKTLSSLSFVLHCEGQTAVRVYRVYNIDFIFSM